jgi:hypothetical protein
MSYKIDRLRADYKRKVIARWKRRKGCMDCGYRVNAEALELDHRPGEKKIGTVSQLLFHAWPKVKTEIAKCDVVCANCHRIRTFQRAGSPTYTTVRYERADRG